ncbi:mercuric reductase [Mucilaginibacter jinjuensis]|uniref:Mercuric reductase n=1 Tax=Mucilaginibacter jinjuensis TaxID=1176721 RepID=A0ABY7T6J3_9SPHI|nr:mercuric reductase [Mucilaginibacter jinjuensis]WCT12001.1 mercuric reductase [Mucilaginibacter jinjuensis]
MKHYDAIVIGAGQAGSPLCRKLANAGKKTLIIEKRWIGGTCVNDGCTPTKAMVASAKAAYLAKRCTDLGVTIDSFHINMKQVKKRKDEIVLKSRNGGLNAIEKTENLDLLFGEASFTGPKTIKVKLNDGGEEEVQADLIFLDAGATPVIPEIDGLKDIDYLTSTSILDLEEVPEHILIIGGNYVALEFAQMFHRFGSKISVLERSERIMAKEDEDVSDGLKDILVEEGLGIYVKAEVHRFEKTADGIKASTIVGGEQKEFTCSHILLAAGRKPLTEALQLDKTGVELDEKGFIKVNEKLETNVPGIYALGDVNGGPAFTHIAYNDYTIVYRNLVEGTNYNTTDRPLPYCMFTDPQLGRVGLTEKQAREQGYDIKVAVLPMKHVARAIEVSDTRGFMKAVVNAKTKEILGAAVLAEEGGEIMSVLQMAMEGGITYDRIRYCVFAHPTYSESLNNLFMKIED